MRGLLSFSGRLPHYGSHHSLAQILKCLEGAEQQYTPISLLRSCCKLLTSLYQSFITAPEETLRLGASLQTSVGAPCVLSKARGKRLVRFQPSGAVYCFPSAQLAPRLDSYLCDIQVPTPAQTECISPHSVDNIHIHTCLCLCLVQIRAPMKGCPRAYWDAKQVLSQFIWRLAGGSRPL